MPDYHLTSEIEVEYFDDQCIIFLIKEEHFVIINKFAASLFLLMHRTFHGPFDQSKCAAVLEDYFQIDKNEADEKAKNLIDQWLHHGLLSTVNLSS
jgi:hypothetical protein